LGLVEGFAPGEFGGGFFQLAGELEMLVDAAEVAVGGGHFFATVDEFPDFSIAIGDELLDQVRDQEADAATANGVADADAAGALRIFIQGGLEGEGADKRNGHIGLIVQIEEPLQGRFGELVGVIDDEEPAGAAQFLANEDGAFGAIIVTGAADGLK
jgi:hypothetical protein